MIKNIRIVHLIDSLDAGGAERMALNYANALSKGISFSGLISSRTEGALKGQICKNVKYLFLNKKNNYDVSAFYKMRKFCVDNKVNFIHAHSSSFFWAVLIKLTLPRMKIIWHDHYGNSEFLNERPRFVLKKASLFFSLIISVNEKLLEWSKKELNCNKMIYLPNFPENKNYVNSTTTLFGNSGKRILCLANLRPQKNHLLVLEIAKLLKKSHSEYSFHLVGKIFNDDYSKLIEEEIKINCLEQNVFLYGSKNDISNIINQSSFGLFTSFSEGLPVSVLELGTNNKTMISSNVGDISKVITDNETGLLINDFEVNNFYQAVVKLIENDTLRKKFEYNLKEKILNEFSSESVLNSYLLKINELN